jgi:hypothetical protein
MEIEAAAVEPESGDETSVVSRFKLLLFCYWKKTSYMPK